VRRINAGIADRVYRCLLDIDEQEGLHLKAFTPAEHVPQLVADLREAVEYTVKFEPAVKYRVKRSKVKFAAKAEFKPTESTRQVRVRKESEKVLTRITQREIVTFADARKAREYFADPEEMRRHVRMFERFELDAAKYAGRWIAPRDYWLKDTAEQRNVAAAVIYLGTLSKDGLNWAVGDLDSDDGGVSLRAFCELMGLNHVKVGKAVARVNEGRIAANRGLQDAVEKSTKRLRDEGP